jgi:hypothetical protein
MNLTFKVPSGPLQQTLIEEIERVAKHLWPDISIERYSSSLEVYVDLYREDVPDELDSYLWLCFPDLLDYRDDT